MKYCFIFTFLLNLFLTPAVANLISFQNAVVVAPEGLSKVEQNAILLLVEEVEKRTQIRLPVSSKWPASTVPVIAVAPVDRIAEFAGPRSAGLTFAGPREPEGFQLRIQGSREPGTVWVVGNDSRGILFGIGRLLREMRMSRQEILLPRAFDLATAPRFPLRGHQLGYRPKTNSYDAFTEEMWKQYIRDLAVFGTNAVELLPPRTDDAPDSPHFPRPQMDMLARMSRILDDLGLDVWMWFPALDDDYSNPATVEFALREWAEVFQKTPRLDVVFVPGGDPGHTPPRVLMNLLEKQTANLRRFHPKAQMWISPQGFNQEWMEDFYRILREERPAWLSGIVFGPQVRVSLPELRSKVPEQYPIRRYPDITHSVRCQYPVPNWDLAYALTEEREVINPRPADQSVIFRALDDYAPFGFLTYSEGVNDDVNKIVWSGLGWDPDTPVVEILRQYSRYFLGPAYSDDFAQGLLALERNWRGPLLTNESVYTTLKQFQTLERQATPHVRLNWRFQQALYRAYYDAYQRSRLLFEKWLEDKAMQALRAASETGSLVAMQRAEEILNHAVLEKTAPDWRARVFELAEALYQSIRMQLSVPRYQAISVTRGAHLDLIDVPLNNRLWLANQFSRIRMLASEAERTAELDALVDWTNPGPGGFYDDLGNVRSQPHLVPGLDYSEDPAFLRSPMMGALYRPDRRVSWYDHAETLYETPLKLQYEGLDPEARYRVRVVYGGDNFRTRIRLLADDIEVHDYLEKPEPLRPLEFDIPVEATRDGKLRLGWMGEPGRGGNGRGNQVAEVWLIKHKEVAP